ncbi:MAG: Transcriptional regulator, TetR family [Chloroflexi bacterium]|nr:Transcriptional regulator, TetR family [Chloroflexota bacterium]
MSAGTAADRSSDRVAQHRGRILDAIVSLVAEQGYHETAVDDVVARARCSKSAFYACFAGKEHAFAALLEREGERLLSAVVDAVAAETDPRLRVAAGVSTAVRGCVGDAATARVLLIESVGVSATIEERRRALHARFAVMVLAQARAAAARDGSPLAGLDLETLAYAVVGAVNEAVVHLLETGGDVEPVLRTIEHLVATALLPR